MAGDSTLDDLLRQIRMTRRFGPFAGILRFSPKYVPLEPDAGTHRRLEAMLLALTPEERRNAEFFGDEERISEISRESGESENDVRKFLRRLDVVDALRGA